MLYSHLINMHIYTYTCRIHIDAMKTSDTVHKKIYLSLYLKGLCVCERGSWRPNRTATYWPPLLWPSALCLSRSPDAQPEAQGPTPMDAGFLYRILSPTDLVSKNSLQTGLQINWIPIFTELYNSSIAHSISPHNWPSVCVTSAVLGMACLIVIERK